MAAKLPEMTFRYFSTFPTHTLLRVSPTVVSENLLANLWFDMPKRPESPAVYGRKWDKGMFQGSVGIFWENWFPKKQLNPPRVYFNVWRKKCWNFLRHSFFPLLSPDVIYPRLPLPTPSSLRRWFEVRKSQEMRSEEFKSYLEQHLGC